MTANRDDAMRDVAREVLDELLHGLINGRTGDVGVNRAAGDAPHRPSRTSDAPGDAPIVPAVPAPPVASTLRPSTWSDPPAPGEVIGEGTPAGRGGTPRVRPATDAASEDRVEPVTIDSDEDLQRFVAALANRLADPRDRMAIGAGRLRFTLARGSSVTSDAVRLIKGVVTERTVRDAAADGARLVLAPGAVLTPLARDRSKALGVEIERERRC